MGSVPNSYIDDLKSIVLATLNRIEQLRMRVLFGVQMIKGPYDQELDFRSDGKIYYNGVELGTGGGTSDHSALTNLNWAAAGHTMDAVLDMGTNAITNVGDVDGVDVSTIPVSKADHDALNIDADTLDSKNSLDFLWLDGSLTMGNDFSLNSDLILFDTIIRDCGGIYAPDNLNMNIGINNGVGVYNTKIEITDDGSKLYDELDANSNPITNLTNVYSDDSASSFTRFYNVNAGNTLKFEIDKSFNTSHQILDMNDNNIVHCGALSGDLAAELVIESKYHALGLTAESGYDVDVFRTLDLNSNALTNGAAGSFTSLDINGGAITDAAMAGTNSAIFKINQDNAGVEASSIEFDRGSVATAARILWSETNDWFSFEEVTGSTKTTIDAAKLQVSDGINLDGATGTIKISEDDATGDMVLQVATGDAIVFKAV